MMKNILGLTLVTMLGGCPDKDPSDTDAGSSGGSTGGASSTTAASMSTTTTPTTGSATDNSGTGGATDAGSSSTGGVTKGTGETTTDGTTGGDVVAQCQAVCDLANTCMLDPGADCVVGCVDDFNGWDGQCQVAIDTYLTCLTTMTFDELTDLFENDDSGPCTDQVAAVEKACDMGGDCTTGIGGDPRGSQCSLITECPDMPALEFQCDEAGCVCLVDGMEVATCPSEMICQTLDQLEAKAADCCGF